MKCYFYKVEYKYRGKNRFRHRHIQSRGQSERWTNKAQKQTTSLPKFTQATGRHIIACTKEAFSNFQAHRIRKKVKVDARKADDSNEKVLSTKKKIATNIEIRAGCIMDSHTLVT